MATQDGFTVPKNLDAGLHFFQGKRQQICASTEAGQFPVLEPGTGQVGSKI